MPLYDYSCPNCAKQSDIWAQMHEEEKPCPTCGATMMRLISGSNIITDLEPYFDENLDKVPIYVESKQHRKQLMKERGLVDLG